MDEGRRNLRYPAELTLVESTMESALLEGRLARPALSILRIETDPARANVGRMAKS